MTKTTKRVIIAAIAAIVATGLIFGGVYLYNLAEYRRIIAGIEIETTDLSQVQDGTFSGFFDSNFVAANVDVTVENHEITQVVITNHYHGNWEHAVSAEVVADWVVAQQTLYVDTVAGATNSSLVILSAIQDALENGIGMNR
ncbi:MAG: FMN-binding protein [Defluviitaleaceae bacterium]|nr:FMN-binding protein [Defluviitaleaceae bacterium]